MQATEKIKCRAGCGACCIYVSISSPIPRMPLGKEFGKRCIQLSDDNFCKLFGKPERPNVCKSLEPSLEMCGESNEYAREWLTMLEKQTAPEK